MFKSIKIDTLTLAWDRCSWKFDWRFNPLGILVFIKLGPELDLELKMIFWGDTLDRKDV